MLQSLGVTKSGHSRATEQQQSFLFTSGQGQIVYELNKGISVYSQTEWQGPLSQAIKFDYNNKSNEHQVKETVSNMESALASSLQQVPSHILSR